MKQVLFAAVLFAAAGAAQPLWAQQSVSNVYANQRAKAQKREAATPADCPEVKAYWQAVVAYTDCYAVTTRSPGATLEPCHKLRETAQQQSERLQGSLSAGTPCATAFANGKLD